MKPPFAESSSPAALQPLHPAFRRSGLWAALLAATMFFILLAANHRMYITGHLTKQDDHVSAFAEALALLEGDWAYQSVVWGNPLGPGPVFSPMTFIFVPSFLVQEKIFNFCILLCLMIVAASLPIYHLGRRRLGPSFGLFAVVFFFLLPETWGLALSGLWQRTPDLFLAPLLLVAFEGRKKKWFALAGWLLLMVKIENIFVLGAFLPLAWLEKRSRSWLWLPLIVCLAYLGFFLLLSGHHSMGRNPWSLLQMISGRWLSLDPWRSLGFFLLSLSPLLWLAFLAPRALLPAIGPLLVALTFQPLRKTIFLPGNSESQYYMMVYLFFLHGALIAIARFFQPGGRLAGRKLAPLLALGLILTVAPGMFRVMDRQVERLFQTTPDVEDFKQLITRIPPTARVAINQPLSYLLERREAVLEFGAMPSPENWYQLNEHFYDLQSLLNFRPLPYAYLVQRTAQELGGLAIISDRGPDREPIIKHLFAPNPYAVTVLDPTNKNNPTVVAGTITRHENPTLGFFKGDGKGGLKLIQRAPIKSPIYALAAGAPKEPILLLTSLIGFSWEPAAAFHHSCPIHPFRPCGAISLPDGKAMRIALRANDQTRLEIWQLDTQGGRSLGRALVLPSPVIDGAWLSPQEMALGCESGELFHVQQGEDGAWSLQPLARLTGRPAALLADRADPRLVWLTATDPNRLWRLRLRDDGGWETAVALEMPPLDSPVTLAQGDTDGDGESEVLIGHQVGNYVTLYSPVNGRSRTLPAGPLSTGIAVLDLDGDGRDEIITTLHNQVPAFSNLLKYFARHAVDTLLLNENELSPEAIRWLSEPTSGWELTARSGNVSLWRRIDCDHP